MNWSVWTEYFHGAELYLEEKAQKFREAGFDFAELSDEDGFALLDKFGSSAAAGREIRRIQESTGIAFRQGHLWLAIHLCDDEYEKKFELLKPWFDMYLEAGIHRGVLHTATERGGFSWAQGRERRLYALGQIRDYLRGTPLVICMENQSRSDHAESAGLLRTLADLDSPNFAVCLDTGHLNMEGEPQEDFIRACGKQLKALHLADNQGKEDQHMMPFGRGTVDFLSVIRACREVGYDGLYNYEIPGENGCPVEVRLMKLRYLRALSDWLEANA